MTDDFVRLGHRPAPVNDLKDHPDVKGFSLDKDLSAAELLAHMATFGFQASHLAQALEVIKAMRREGATIFFSFTGNMVSSGLRELIRYLVQHKYVDVLVTNAGGVEEDVMKCFKPFKLGRFSAQGKALFDESIHRIGNIFVPTDRYAELDKFLSPLLDDVFSEHRKVTPSQLLRIVGERLDHDESILTWASRNDIPVFCPGIQDGSFGQLFYFRTQKDPDFAVDISRETKEITDIAMTADSTGTIVLGGGIAKHFTLLNNILRDGLDYAVFINTGQEFDGSDSGARPDEAVSWAKLNVQSLRVKVHADATIAFPLLALSWMEWERSRGDIPLDSQRTS